MQEVYVPNKEVFDHIVEAGFDSNKRFVGDFFKINGSPWLDYPFVIRTEGNHVSMRKIKQDEWKIINEVRNVDKDKEDIRSYNVGNSDYSKHKIQPWQLWIEYKLNPFDADIVKRVLRHKKGEPRRLDYEKIIHVCKERIRQIDEGEDPWSDEYKD